MTYTYEQQNAAWEMAMTDKRILRAAGLICERCNQQKVRLADGTYDCGCNYADEPDFYDVGLAK